MVGYFVKMLWNIKRLKCSLRFERKNIILFKKPTTSPQIQFDIFYLQLTCGQIALAQMQFWFSHWREAKSFQMTRCLYFPPLELVCQAALLIMFWLSFCTPFKVGRESGCPICHLHPRQTRESGNTDSRSISVLWTVEVLGQSSGQSWQKNSCLLGAHLLLVHSIQERWREVSKHIVCPGSLQPPPPSLSHCHGHYSAYRLNFPGISLLVLPILALPFLLSILLPKRSSWLYHPPY